jgi:hypothetical protein
MSPPPKDGPFGFFWLSPFDWRGDCFAGFDKYHHIFFEKQSVLAKLDSLPIWKLMAIDPKQFRCLSHRPWPMDGSWRACRGNVVVGQSHHNSLLSALVGVIGIGGFDSADSCGMGLLLAVT